MQKNIVRKYYLADLYVLDCTIKDENDVSTSIEDRLKPVGKFIVCPNKNGNYFEKLTGKSVGSLDKDLVEFGGFSDGFDYPNIYVDDNSLIKLSSEELKEYLDNKYPTNDNSVLEAYFERLTILNGMLPARRTYYDVRIVTLMDDYDEAFKVNKDYEKYVVDQGNYIVRKAEHGLYVELITGKKFGSYGTDFASLHVNPYYYVYRTYSKTNPTLFVDKEGASLIPNSELFDRVKEYTTMNTKKELNEVFEKASEVSTKSSNNMSLGFKMKQNDDEKE